MLYCPPNVTFFTIWYQRGFSLCFVETASVTLLTLIMLIFGTAELMMYRRYGSKLDDSWLKPLPKLYLIQLICNSFLICCPFIWLGLRYWSAQTVYGYMITYNILAFYVWSMSLWLLILERNYDLPTPPGAGHSVLLNCFWGLALALDSLCFVNFNGDQWYFIFHSSKDRVLLAVFVLRWICTFLLFVLGMLAPGMVSIERRGQFTYRELVESSATKVKYGSTATVESSTSANEFLASIERLRTQLANGDLQLGFRSAYRQKAGQPVDAALKPENTSKNRYSNVLPYDYNRVVLKTSSKSTIGGANSNGDYVNASWITVRLPSSKSVEQRYIATQGPMQNTIIDFWRMIFEQRVHTVVMLTDLMEAELPKCHQYWPEGENAEEAQEYGSLLVSCIRTDYNIRHVIREFSVIHVQSQAELNVVQIQCKGWPDHGVPKKPQFFLDFLDLVHSVAPEHREENPPPLLIHCSAGIGRTGVYIMAETFVKCIDTSVPLRPLELMQILRDQRMGMVQTEQQFLFVCELALKYYDKHSSSRRN